MAQDSDPLPPSGSYLPEVVLRIGLGGDRAQPLLVPGQQCGRDIWSWGARPNGTPKPCIPGTGAEPAELRTALACPPKYFRISTSLGD